MAEILTFPARRHTAPSAPHTAAPAASAAILFFTGVRYERPADAMPAKDEPVQTTPGPQKPRGRRRA